MDDLAPAPTQLISDSGGRTSGQNFTARKKAAKNAAAELAENRDPEPELVPDSEPEGSHQLDILA